MRFVERYRRLTDAPAAVKVRLPAADLAHRLDQLAAAMIGADPIVYASAVRPPRLRLNVDPDLLEQAAINLLKNAVEAVRGRPGPAVRLEIARSEDQIVLSVADNGPGLPVADPESAFVPFFTTKPDGSGIGLAVARQIALAHGGRLDYRAAPTGGAVFHMVLPSA